MTPDHDRKAENKSLTSFAAYIEKVNSDVGIMFTPLEFQNIPARTKVRVGNQFQAYLHVHEVFRLEKIVTLGQGEYTIVEAKLGGYIKYLDPTGKSGVLMGPCSPYTVTVITKRTGNTNRYYWWPDSLAK